MSIGDAPAQDQLTANYDSDDSSSKSIFNRSSIRRVSPQLINTQCTPVVPEQISSAVKAINNEQVYNTNSQIRFLEDKINDQNATLYNQQSEMTNLHKIIQDLYNQLHHLKAVVNSAPHSPILHSRPISVHHNMHQNDTHQHLNHYPSTSPMCIQYPHETYTLQPVQTTSVHHSDTLASADQIRNLQEALYKSNAALERRDTEINNLRKKIHEIRDSQLTSGKASPNPSTNIPPLAAQNSHTSAFVPILATDKPRPVTLSTNTFTSPPIMPFTMSLTNTLPSFSGKEGEMPTKFITEFEIRASSLVGHNDDYLLRAVQLSLTDTALTWYIQTQQEQPVNNWVQFKQLFLRRFRTPEKIELLRGRLRTLRQGDNEPTADYFERLKALISKIEPQTSTDYIKRKFLQKLRKDIRDKMTLSLTSSLSDLVQKAIEIESNIAQQKIDDKLRDAHKEDNNNKQKSTTVNNLFNVSQPNPSSLTTYNHQASYDNYKNNSKYNSNKQNHHSNKYSRTFINSTTSPHRSSQIQNESHISRQVSDRNIKVKPHNNIRWCSFCSSASHTWFRCYSNPNSPNYQPERYQHVQQQPYQRSMSSSHYSQQHNYQSPNQHELIHQQQPPQQHYQQSHSSSYFTAERPSMTGNIQGSRP
ncbi:unnamed protein product [Rotaria sp. Silwood2]|nr:unnamed protein product [Rotaria sp. Silwood2]